jgi:ankyrin repeat protein
MTELLHSKSQQKVDNLSNGEINLIKKEIDLFVENLMSLDVQGAKNKIQDERFGINKSSILHLAAKFGDLAAFEKLIAIASGDRLILDICDSHAFTPLHLAAIRGEEEIVEILLKENCNPNAAASVEKRNWRPIHYASQYGHLAIVKALINRGVNFDERTFFQLTPLIIAAEFGKIEVLDFLIKIGANLNATTNNENNHMNALHYAVIDGHQDCVIHLLKAGIKKDEYTVSGLDALDFAAKIDNVEMLKILLQWGVGEVGHALIVAKENNSFASKAILENYLKIISDLFNKNKLAILQKKLIADLKNFNQENFSDAKINFDFDVSFNADGILSLEFKSGLIRKVKKSFKGFVLENGFFNLAEELSKIAKLK